MIMLLKISFFIFCISLMNANAGIDQARETQKYKIQLRTSQLYHYYEALQYYFSAREKFYGDPEIDPLFDRRDSEQLKKMIIEEKDFLERFIPEVAKCHEKPLCKGNSLVSIIETRIRNLRFIHARLEFSSPFQGEKFKTESVLSSIRFEVLKLTHKKAILESERKANSALAGINGTERLVELNIAKENIEVVTPEEKAPKYCPLSFPRGKGISTYKNEKCKVRPKLVINKREQTIRENTKNSLVKLKYNNKLSLTNIPQVISGVPLNSSDSENSQTDETSTDTSESDDHLSTDVEVPDFKSALSDLKESTKVLRPRELKELVGIALSHMHLTDKDLMDSFDWVDFYLDASTYFIQIDPVNYTKAKLEWKKKNAEIMESIKKAGPDPQKILETAGTKINSTILTKKENDKSVNVVETVLNGTYSNSRLSIFLLDFIKQKHQDLQSYLYLVQVGILDSNSSLVAYSPLESKVYSAENFSTIKVYNDAIYSPKLLLHDFLKKFEKEGRYTGKKEDYLIYRHIPDINTVPGLEKNEKGSSEDKKMGVEKEVLNKDKKEENKDGLIGKIVSFLKSVGRGIVKFFKFAWIAIKALTTLDFDQLRKVWSLFLSPEFRRLVDDVDIGVAIDFIKDIDLSLLNDFTKTLGYVNSEEAKLLLKDNNYQLLRDLLNDGKVNPKDAPAWIRKKYFGEIQEKYALNNDQIRMLKFSDIVKEQNDEKAFIKKLPVDSRRKLLELDLHDGYEKVSYKNILRKTLDAPLNEKVQILYQTKIHAAEEIFTESLGNIKGSYDDFDKKYGGFTSKASEKFSSSEWICEELAKDLFKTSQVIQKGKFKYFQSSYEDMLSFTGRSYFGSSDTSREFFKRLLNKSVKGSYHKEFLSTYDQITSVKADCLKKIQSHSYAKLQDEVTEFWLSTMVEKPEQFLTYLEYLQAVKGKEIKQTNKLHEVFTSNVLVPILSYAYFPCDSAFKVRQNPYYHCEKINLHALKARAALKSITSFLKDRVVVGNKKSLYIKSQEEINYETKLHENSVKKIKVGSSVVKDNQDEDLNLPDIQGPGRLIQITLNKDFGNNGKDQSNQKNINIKQELLKNQKALAGKKIQGVNVPEGMIRLSKSTLDQFKFNVELNGLGNLYLIAIGPHVEYVSTREFYYLKKDNYQPLIDVLGVKLKGLD